MLIRRVKNHLELSFEHTKFFAEKYNKNIYFSDEKSPIREKISSFKFKELEEELKTIPENEWYEIVKGKSSYMLFEI